MLIIIFILLFIIFVFSHGPTFSPEELDYGVTFSPRQARALGFDWRTVFGSVLDDLGVKKVRLAAYWDEVEPASGQYAWEDLDWLINRADEAGAEIILAVGGRLPRWPECHFPDWAKSLTDEARERKILEYMEKTVMRYIGEESIVAWQVENEPFLSHFGECPETSGKFLDKEIALVRSLDDRPVVITDSGELSIWVPAARRADIFGTTMYRDTYSQHLKRYIHYPIRPGFFKFKKNITRLFAHPKKWIVIELQAEPWGPIPFREMAAEERSRTMDAQKFRDIVEFGRRAGFREFYLWGAEWWYWEKETNGRAEMWEEAKRLFDR